MAMMSPSVPNSAHARSRFIGRYELIGELARGGMGTVFLARHAGEAGFQRLFAIKVMHPHLAEDREFVDMLRDEARIAARIHHPNVVSILDIGVQEQLHYVVMDYVEGPPFGTLIKRSGTEPILEKIVAVVIDTLDGIHAAHTVMDDDGHELNLVHRDISPQNILVGADGVARITDFGIAKAETRISSTRPGTRKGKLAFMAPEQITNDELVDRRADIWAAGVVLWTGLTGRNLFRADGDAATIHNVLSKEIVPPSRVGRKPPEFLDEVVMRALERDPQKRFGSALEMADALRSAAAQHGLKFSRQQVAGWVSSLFGEELNLRRKAIRSVARRREEQEDLTEASQITVLPALPGIIGNSSGYGTLPGATSVGDTGSIVTGPGGVATGKVSGAQVNMGGQSPQAAHSNPAKWIGIGLLGLGILAAAAVAVSVTRAPAPSPAQAAPAEPVSHAAPPAAPAAAETVAAAAPVAPAAPSAAQANTDVTKDDAAESTEKSDTRRSVRHYVRRATRVPNKAAAVAVPAQTAPEPAPAEDDAKSKAAPVPTAAPAGGFEKNPYLRR